MADVTTATNRKEMLKELAALAGEGSRMFVLVGKVKELRRSVNATTGEVRIYSQVISGEGDSVPVNFDPLSSVQPGVGATGAFLISPRTFRESIAGFNCTEFVLS